jgi:hypothetical protein
MTSNQISQKFLKFQINNLGAKDDNLISNNKDIEIQQNLNNKLGNSNNNNNEVVEEESRFEIPTDQAILQNKMQNEISYADIASGNQNSNNSELSSTQSNDLESRLK